MKSSGAPLSVVLSRSPPSRGAWIEIPLFYPVGRGGGVAPLAGGVD